MPSAKVILTTSIVLGGGLWALVKICGYFVRRKRTVIHRLQLNPLENDAAASKPVLNDTSSIFEKQMNTPSYKGMYLTKFAKNTVRKYEVCSGARIHIEHSSTTDLAHYSINGLVTNRSLIKIVGSQSQIYMAESYLNEILTKISYKIVMASFNRLKNLRQKRRLDIPKMEWSSRTMIIRDEGQNTNQRSQTTDGYNLAPRNENEKYATFYVIGRRKDVAEVAANICGYRDESKTNTTTTLKQSTPIEKSCSIAQEFEEECLEVTKNIWSESSQSDSKFKNTPTVSSSSRPSTSSSNTSNRLSNTKYDADSPSRSTNITNATNKKSNTNEPPKNSPKVTVSSPKSTAKQRRTAKKQQQ